jgi:hypothetical protein
MDNNFQYPKRLHDLLNTLVAKYSATDNTAVLKQIVQSAKPELELEIGYDEWNGGTDYHKLTLRVPLDVFKLMKGDESSFAREIQRDINSIDEIRNEGIGAVTILVQEHLKKSDDKPIDESMWGTGFRIFISHRVEDKKQAAKLKHQLERFGMTAFVAHEDIEPKREWLDTIENALFSMDAFIALITDGYNEKPWTSQEVGFAYCLHKTRNIPFISVRLGDDPKGFIQPIQAFSPKSDNFAKDICLLWIDNPKLIDSLVNSLCNSRSFAESEFLFDFMKNIKRLTDDQISNLVNAFNENGQLSDCFKLNGESGCGIIPYLNKWSNSVDAFKMIKTKNPTTYTIKRKSVSP